MLPSIGDYAITGPLFSQVSVVFSRTRLSKALITNASKVEWRSLTELQSKFGVKFRTGIVGP